MRTPSFLRNKVVQASLGLGAAVALLFTGGAVQAALVGSTSGSSLSDTEGTESAAWQLPAAAQNTWVNVPGMTRTVTVPSGATRKLNALYGAESLCQGSNGSWCSVRIIAVNASTGATNELHPRSGTDYAFDSPGINTGFEWEGHVRPQSIRLGAGTYRVLVQAARVNGGASTTSPSFRLDEQYFNVEVRA